jgi:hypothetical protein
MRANFRLRARWVLMHPLWHAQDDLLMLFIDARLGGSGCPASGTGARPQHARLEGLHRGDDLPKSRGESGPGLRTQCADEPSLNLFPDRERVRQELAARFGEGGGPLAPRLPREDPKASAPDQGLEGAVKGRAVQYQSLGESAERDRTPQVDRHEDGELRGAQIDRREGGLVEPRDRPGGSAEPSPRALGRDAC